MNPTRRRRIWLAAVLAGLIALGGRASVGWGEDQSDASIVTSGDRIDALLRELSADPWPRRTQAQEELVGMGDEVRPRLEHYLRRAPDEESRLRAEEVLGRIQRNRESGPTLVSLSLKDVPPAEALAALAREAGLPAGTFQLPTKARAAMPIFPGIPNFRRGLDGNEPISIETHRRPFWEVFREICAQGKLEPAGSANGALALSGGTGRWAMTKSSISGPFMLTVSRIDQRPSDILRRGARTLTLRLQAFAEPKLKCLSWSVLRVDECVTETGRSLPLVPLRSVGVFGQNVNTNAETPLTVMAPADSAGWITSLQLTARYLLEVRSDTLEIANPLQAIGETHGIGQMQVNLRAFREVRDKGYSYTLTIGRGGLAPEQWQQAKPLIAQFPPKIVDADGRPLVAWSTSSLSPSEDEVIRTCEIQQQWPGGTPTGPPAKLVWQFPVEVRQLEGLFHFRDLKLPE